MSIQLQVVGIFYNVNLAIDGAGKTVKDVMDAAVANPGGEAGSVNGAAAFNYGTHIDSPGATPTMSLISAKYSAPFTSRVLTNHYPAGQYALMESFDPQNPGSLYTVWQYYLFDQNGVFVPGSSVSESFVTRPVDNVSKVVWRLVSILGGPSVTEEQMSVLTKRDPAMRAAPAA